MTDETLSTTITEAPTVSGGGVVNTPDPAASEPEGKQSSVGDTLRSELAKARGLEKANEAKAEPKAETPKDEAKPEAEKPEPKPQESDRKPDAPDSDKAKEAPAQPDEGDVSSEGKKPDPAARTKYDSPPEKVAPHARDKWANVPREIKAEVHRIVEAQDADTRQYQEDRKFREDLREYDELAKQAGVPLKQAMARYVDIDRRLTSSDANTRARTVLEVMQSSNVDPVQFARTILANEGQFKQQPQARPDPMVHQMAQQLQEMRAMLQDQQAAPVRQQNEQAVANFSADKPDFDSLQEDIADILKSGMIQKRFPGLAPDQLLMMAYQRAGGTYLTSQSGTRIEQQDPPTTEEPPRPVNPDAGRKSISGAPTGGKIPLEESKAKSLRDLIAEESRKKRA